MMSFEILKIDGCAYLVIPKDYTVQAKINNSFQFESSTGFPAMELEAKLNENILRLLRHYVALFMPQIIPADLYFDYTDLYTFVGQLNRHEIRAATPVEKDTFCNKEVITLYYDYNTHITL
ncbi:hypothetical protein AAE02nite_44110 [Adhaeribacter aerolatus]|uniref:Uncharacterized protein n=1 Tax=Adhaeribacter aerolatus TaxID=670289 RepID=A0A512B4R0_9BACT|nr:hypothetical protein [Adhaeribacter aerolatus]GEO06747.1 hypothetical protein AAE02nite_44110 [Adhaeribacter aerolatus]